jgi:mRNA interferase RelE/StbE
VGRRLYRVDVERAELHPEIRRRILQALVALENDPRPPGCQKLKGNDDLYRIRVGDYRIVYSVDDDGRIIIVLVAAHRRDVYRDL